MNYPIRINKYLRDKGWASRREADEIIAAGRVLVNGKNAKQGMLINENDEVALRRPNKKKYKYLIYYKPRGLATQAPGGQESVIAEWRSRGLFPVGRLDKESEGLLILTDDRRITPKIIGSNTGIEKEYLVRVKEPLRQGIAAIFKRGMQTKALGKLLPANARIVGEHALCVILQEGKKHQIRVMLAELGYTVTALKRIRIGHIFLGNLKLGQTRELTKEEIEKFS